MLKQVLKPENRWILALVILEAAACAVLLGGVLLFGFTVSVQDDEANALSQQITSLNTTLGEKDAALYAAEGNITQLSTALAARDSELAQANADLAEASSTLAEKSDALSTVEGEVQNASAELDALEARLANRMAWFKQNADITPIPEYDRIRNALIVNCIQIRGSTCSIRLACLPFSNEYISKIVYRTDEELLGYADVIQNLTSIYYHKGGDCEDISLLDIAELNYLTGYCKEKTRTESPDIVFEAWVSDPGSMGEYILTYNPDREYYYTERQAVLLPEEYKYYYMACGCFAPDSGISPDACGHCTLAFTTKEVKSTADVYGALKDALIVEAQSGELMYDLRYSHSMAVPADGDTPPLNYLYHLMTSEDIYDYPDVSYEVSGVNKWAGFADLLDTVRDKKAELTSKH
jgi:hypothetical protein